MVFRRFCPSDCAGDVADAVAAPVQGERQVRVLGQRIGKESARVAQRGPAYRADRSGSHRDAIPQVVSSAVKVEADDVFQRLTARDETTHVADPRVAGDSAHFWIDKWHH